MDYTILNTSQKLLHVQHDMFLCKDVICIILSDVLSDEEVIEEDQELMVENISFAMLIANNHNNDNLLPMTVAIRIVKLYNKEINDAMAYWNSTIDNISTT